MTDTNTAETPGLPGEDTTTRNNADRPRLSNAELRRVARKAVTISEVTRALGLAPCGPANQFARDRLASLNIPDPTWRGGRPTPGREYLPRQDRRSGPYRPAPHEPVDHRAAWVTGTVGQIGPVLLTARDERGIGSALGDLALGLDRTPEAVRVKARPAGAWPPRPVDCKGCGTRLPPPRARGRARLYCDERCRDRHRRAGTAAARAKTVASKQEPCEFCGGTAAPAARVVRFCSKSCAKKLAYRLHLDR